MKRSLWMSLLLIISGCTTVTTPTVAWDHKYIADPASLSLVKNIETTQISPEAEIIKFQLQPYVKKLNSGAREELTDRTKYHNGQSAELEIALRIPKQVLLGQPASTTLFQWHESLTEGSKRPPISLKLRGHQLEIFAWNDETFGRGMMDGDGERVASIPWVPDRWYRIQLRTGFSPLSGELKITLREANEIKELSSAPTRVLCDRKMKLGYKEALSYYFKFGPYTTLPFQRPLTVEYFVPNQPRRVL